MPIPYDFDYTGLVDAPYAAPPEKVKVRTVRTRRYRGYCSMNEEVLNAIAQFRTHKTEFLAVYDDIPGLSKSTKRSATTYLEAFFKDIETDKKVEKKLFRYCR